jgi:uncharacterized protein
MIARLCIRYATIGLIALAIGGLARPAAAANPSPAALAIAKQIVDIKGVAAMYSPLVRGVVEKVKNQFMQTNFMYAKDLNEIAFSLEQEYAPRAHELVDATARIYAERFSEPELKELLAFYQSPTGRKMVVEEPKILDDSMAHAGEWGDALSAEIIEKMRTEMKRRGHDI